MRNKTKRTTTTVQIQELQPVKARQNTDLANHRDAATKTKRKGQKMPDDLPDRRPERGRTAGKCTVRTKESPSRGDPKLHRKRPDTHEHEK